MRDPLIGNVKVASVIVMMILLVCIAVAMSVYSKDVRPKIFVYDLPEKWHDEAKWGPEINAPSCFYTVDKLFPRLLRDSRHYTNNSAEADFFYVSSTLGKPMGHTGGGCWPGGSVGPPSSRQHSVFTCMHSCRLTHGCTGAP